MGYGRECAVVGIPWGWGRFRRRQIVSRFWFDGAVVGCMSVVWEEGGGWELGSDDCAGNFGSMA